MVPSKNTHRSSFQPFPSIKDDADTPADFATGEVGPISLIVRERPTILQTQDIADM